MGEPIIITCRECGWKQADAGKYQSCEECGETLVSYSYPIYNNLYPHDDVKEIKPTTQPSEGGGE